jgi:hypothetical protein
MATGVYESDSEGWSMDSAVMGRPQKPFKIDQASTGKAKVLKFDCRAGVVWLEKTEIPSKPTSGIWLVRDLLALLGSRGPAVRLRRRTQATKSR